MGLILALVLWNCTGADGRQKDPLVASPSSSAPLQLEEIHLEQRQSGRVRWSATALGGRGSPERFEMTELCLQVTAKSAEQAPLLTVLADHGTFHGEEGVAELCEVIGHGANQLQMRAPGLRWKKATSQVQTMGPIDISARGGSVRAEHAETVWPDGDVVLFGDVRGQLLLPSS